MKFDYRKLIFIFLSLVIGEVFTYSVSHSLSNLIGFGELGIAILLFIFLSFVVTYFYYPYFLRKKIFKNLAYYKDVGSFLLLYLVFYAIIMLIMGVI